MALNPWQTAIEQLALSMGLKGQAQQQVYQSPQFDALITQFFGPIPLPAGVDESQVISRTGRIVEYKDAQGYVHRLERDINGTSSVLGQVTETSTNRPPILPPQGQTAQNQQSLLDAATQGLLGAFGGQSGQTYNMPPGSYSPTRSQNMAAPGRGGSMYIPNYNPAAANNLSNNLNPTGQQGGLQLPDFSFLTQMLQQQFAMPGPQMPDFGALNTLLSRQTSPAPQIQMPSFSSQVPQLSPVNTNAGGGASFNGGQFDAVYNRLMAPTQLVGLQGADLQNLAAIKAATDAQLAQQFQAGQSNLISSLYGRNVNQSTIANKSAADLLQAQQMVQLQANSEAAQRQLGLQQFLTQTQQGNLALAGQTAASQASASNQAAGINAQLAAAMADVNARMSIAQGQLGLGYQQLQGQLGLDYQQLALQRWLQEQQLAQQQAQTMSQSLFQQGQLGLGAYGAYNDNRNQMASLLANSLFQQGQLGISGYTAQQGVASDQRSQMMQILNMLSQLDLNRQIASGQLGLDQARLAQSQQQFNAQMSWQQELQRIQERAARDAFTRQLWTAGLGAVGSLITGGLTGGGILSGLGGLFGGGGSGNIYGAGSAWPGN